MLGSPTCLSSIPTLERLLTRVVAMMGAKGVDQAEDKTTEGGMMGMVVNRAKGAMVEAMAGMTSDAVTERTTDARNKVDATDETAAKETTTVAMTATISNLEAHQPNSLVHSTVTWTTTTFSPQPNSMAAPLAPMTCSLPRSRSSRTARTMMTMTMTTKIR